MGVSHSYGVSYGLIHFQLLLSCLSNVLVVSLGIHKSIYIDIRPSHLGFQWPKVCVFVSFLLVFVHILANYQMNERAIISVSCL